MSKLEPRIQALLKKAEPLRLLDDEDKAKEPLAGIVEEINKLRAEQAQEAAGVISSGDVEAIEAYDAAKTAAVLEGDNAKEDREAFETAAKAADVSTAKAKKKPGRPAKKA